VGAALETARQCRTLLGASGITLEYPVLRHASNLESVLTYEGTEEVHQLAAGKAVTGYSAFRLAATPEEPRICGNPALVGRLPRPLRLSVVVMTGRAL
jgi:Acyl-CoA dehydrogenase, C-terminal domain